MKVIDLEPDEATLIPVDKKRHRVSIRDESDSRQTVLIEPLNPEPKQEEET